MQSSSLLKQFSKQKPCYYCGAPPPSTREHAPVRFMLEAFNCDSITVPSCDKHNSEKNLDDRALVAFMLSGLYYSLLKGSFSANVMKALVYSHPKLSDAKEVDLRPFLSNRDDVLSFPLSHIADTESVFSWMRQLTAALTWSVVGEYDPSIDWNGSEVFSPNYIKGDRGFSTDEGIEKIGSRRIRAESLNRAALKWWPGWSSYPDSYPPDIYRFEISFCSMSNFNSYESNRSVMFRHRFYSQFDWYVINEFSEHTKIELQKIVQSLEENE